MAERFKCHVTLGSFRQDAYTEGGNGKYDAERALKKDVENMNERELEAEFNPQVTCEAMSEGEPGRFDEEVEPGVWLQR